MNNSPIRNTLFILTITVIFLQLSGCGSSNSEPVALNDVADGTSSPYPAGEALFNSVCFACHGDDAGGRFVRKSCTSSKPFGQIAA